MNGAFMLMAFVVGFWCIWSANRDVNSLFESMNLVVVAIVTRSVMEWSGAPQVDGQFLASWGVIWVYTLVVLELIERFSSSMGKNLTISMSGAIGWFALAQYIFSEAGQKMVMGWIS